MMTSARGDCIGSGAGANARVLATIVAGMFAEGATAEGKDALRLERIMKRKPSARSATSTPSESAPPPQVT
jgi:hypothetical protein